MSSTALAFVVSLQKGLLSLITIVGVLLLTWQGVVEADPALSFIKWILSAWLIAQAAEDVTTHLSGSHPMDMLLRRKVTQENAVRAATGQSCSVENKNVSVTGA